MMEINEKMIQTKVKKMFFDFLVVCTSFPFLKIQQHFCAIHSFDDHITDSLKYWEYRPADLESMTLTGWTFLLMQWIQIYFPTIERPPITYCASEKMRFVQKK